MPYYNSSDSDDYEDDGNYFIECSHCDAQVLQRNYQRHLDKVHKCQYCTNYMPRESLDGHIQRKHIVACKDCPAMVLECNIHVHERTHFIDCNYCTKSIHEREINIHIRQSHAYGMIQLQKISDARFNQLVAANRIFSSGGNIFIRN